MKDLIVVLASRKIMEAREQGVPIDVENQCLPLVTSVRKEFDSMPSLSSSCCIYRVPERLRSVGKKLYTPQVVSIGPLHHGKEGLNIILENHKKRYLQDFLGRTGESLEHYIEKIKDQEVKLRSCYAEPIKFSSDEFVRIILLDAAFIIELLLKDHFKQLIDDNDRIFHKPWMIQDIRADMWLLENQLPFFILEDLFDPQKIALAVSSKIGKNTETLSIIQLSCYFCKTLLHIPSLEKNLERICSLEAAHFVELFKKVYELNLNLGKAKAGGEKEVLLAPTIPCLTELQQAGIKFRVRPGYFFDFQFTDGILEIPGLTLGCEIYIIRNVLAFEQCHCRDTYICDYVVVMNGLLRSQKDVELLLEYEILALESVSDTSEYQSTLNLANGVTMNHGNFYYTTLCNDLNKYYRKAWNRWNANLKQNYFNTPWTTLSVFAAVIILVLTIIQTVCSILSSKFEKN